MEAYIQIVVQKNHSVEIEKLVVELDIIIKNNVMMGME
jgi:hypothetical protein